MHQRGKTFSRLQDKTDKSADSEGQLSQWRSLLLNPVTQRLEPHITSSLFTGLDGQTDET